MAIFHSKRREDNYMLETTSISHTARNLTQSVDTLLEVFWSQDRTSAVDLKLVFSPPFPHDGWNSVVVCITLSMGVMYKISESVETAKGF